MKITSEIYEELMSLENLNRIETEDALERIGNLADISFDLKEIDGLKRAIEFSEELENRQNLTDDQLSTLNYYVANCWSSLKELKRKGTELSWEWEQEEIEKEVLHLRKALNSDGFNKQIKLRQCQILTNLGNSFDHVGRFVEAIEYYDRAIEIDPEFGMAIGNKGISLRNYAERHNIPNDAALLLKNAYSNLKRAIELPLQGNAGEAFRENIEWIESVLSKEYIEKDIDMAPFPIGDSEEEISYRKWCLKNRLFLNPLNDLGPFPIASEDILTNPSIVVALEEGPYYHGFFNQIKQEFVSARYLFYGGANSDETHFSDKYVLLHNTLDYPSYSLAIEKVKTAFRIAYSLLDKIAFFLNHYLMLGIPEHKVSFKSFWYQHDGKSGKKFLDKTFTQSKNLPLRGLFWLSKDLYEVGFKDSTEPDAQKINEIRNHLEHRYLKLHEYWTPSPDDKKTSNGLADTLAFSIGRSEFEEKTLRLLKLVRASLNIPFTIHTH